MQNHIRAITMKTQLRALHLRFSVAVLELNLLCNETKLLHFDCTSQHFWGSSWQNPCIRTMSGTCEQSI